MNEIIEKYSNEKLEDVIARVYQTAQQEHPGIRLNEEKHPFLKTLWDEFEARLEIGTIPADTNWAPKEWREGYYE